jgi:hypothetical protein
MINEHICYRISSIIRKNSLVLQQQMAPMLQPRKKKIMTQRLEAALKDFSPANGDIHTALVN